jgi:hypothetical protein
MANLVQELNSLDFSVYIGGPLQAAVNAQHAASMSQVSFINEVGFTGTGDDKEVRYVEFKYLKKTPNPHYQKTSTQLNDQGLPSTTDTINQFLDQNVEIQVPFLAMLTIPALRIEEVNIDFNAKLTSVETTTASSEFAGEASISAKFWKVNFKASASYKRSTTSSSNVEKTYNLGVKVRAVNDELPAGLDRILTMLEESIVRQEGAPTSPPSSP